MVKDWMGDVAHGITQLRARVRQSWYRLNDKPDIFHKLMESMPRRLQNVINNNGGYTRY